jgi:pimeloyl-ACP methyl ester carboxylesterase
MAEGEVSQVLETMHGPVEYATAGEGPTTLVVLNGAGGSYRHGLLMAEILEGLPVRVVGLSRPGYHRTPLESGRTVEAQADLAAAVLDQLGIEQAFIAGISAGGIPAIQFALRHPQRCMGLVLLSAANPAMNLTKPGPWQRAQATFLKVSLRFDLPLRLMVKNFERPLCRQMKWTPDDVDDLLAWNLIHEVMSELTPTNLWADGAVNDIKQALISDPSMLERIAVPTLIIHGTRDEQVTYKLAQYAAKVIPHSELVPIEGGSHMILATHWKTARQKINEFINKNL